MGNVLNFELNKEIKDLEYDIKFYQSQLAAIKKAQNILEPFRDFYFFSVTCHALNEEKKKIAANLLELRIKQDRIKTKLSENNNE